MCLKSTGIISLLLQKSTSWKYLQDQTLLMQYIIAPAFQQPLESPMLLPSGRFSGIFLEQKTKVLFWNHETMTLLSGAIPTSVEIGIKTWQ